MNQDELLRIRSCVQQISGSQFSTAEQIATWMGALQAQDYSMSKWAFGIRLPSSTEETVNKEIDEGKIIRTHALRPTWHFVPAKDLHWIIELSAQQIKTAMSYRDKQLELTENVFNHCNNLIERSLRDQNHKSREELITELKNANIRVDENRASHIFMRAEIEGIICSGKQKKGKITYALIRERIPLKGPKLTREEALKELAHRYFTSRGPATIKDFSWWSGLSASRANLALELNKPELQSIMIADQTYWFSDSIKKTEIDPYGSLLLPSYDEFLISYRNREAAISQTDHKTAVSNNGVFYPTILTNGKIAGTWKRNIKGDTVFISTNMFSKENKDLQKHLNKSLIRYSEFLNKKPELIIG